MLVSVAGVAACCFVILSGRAAAMQYAPLQPVPMNDEDPRSAMRLPVDATRSEWDDENVHARGHQAVPWTNPFALTTANREQPLLSSSPSLPRDLGPAPGLGDPEHKDSGTAGAGFGASCGPRESCSSSLGLTCLRIEGQDYRCGCAAETPVFINEGGVKKCVRAKSMYESCVSHLECSYQNPNLQCVDFLCYCPLPYVLTEGHRCIAQSDPHNNMVFAIAPAAMLIAVILMIGGAYTYKRVVGGAGGAGGGWSSASSIAGLRASIDRPSDSMRRVSSSIRMGRKAEASRRMRRSLDEHGAALLRDSKTPRHPPRYIRSRPRELSVQKPFFQGVRAKVANEKPSWTSDSESVVPRHSNPVPIKAAANERQILPVQEEVAVHIIRKSSTSGPDSQEPSTEVPWMRQAQEELGRWESPSRLLPRDDALHRVLHQAEVKVSVERHGSTSDGARPLPSKFFRGLSSSQPSGLLTSKLREQAKTESTTEDSFMREIRYQITASVPRPSMQDRAMSTDLVFTMDSAVQPDNAVPDMVDRSQQMSDLPNLGIVPTTIVPARKSVEIIRQQTTVPVHMLVQEIESKQRAANIVEAPEKKIEVKTVKPQLVSLKETKEKPKIDTRPIRETREQSGTFGGRQLIYLKRIFSDSLPSTTDQAVTKDPPPPLVKTAKDDFEQPAKADFVHVATDSHSDEKGKRGAGIVRTTVPTSPRSGTTVLSGVSTTRSPAFSDVLQELLQQHARRKARAASRDDALCNVPEKTTTPGPCGHSSTAADSVTGRSPTGTGSPVKGSVKESPFHLAAQETSRSLSSALSPRFYTTTVEESNMLCPAVQGIAASKKSGKVTNETRSDEGKTCIGIPGGSTAGSLNIPASAIEQPEPRLGRSRLHPHTVRDDGFLGEKQAASTQQGRLGRSSDNLNTSVGKTPSKVYAWGDSFSVSGETPSDESRLEGYVPPNSPGNSGTGQAISLRQELEAANAAADINLEQTFRYPRIANNWSLTSPEAVLGSMDVESSETSLGGLRATFKDSVDVTSRMLVPRDEATCVVPALKDKKDQGSKRKKRVNFQEKPFADVLAEIEDDCPMPYEADLAEDDKKEIVNNDSVAEEASGSSKSENEQDIYHAFNEYRGGDAGNTDSRKVEDDEEENEENRGGPPTAIAQGETGRNASIQTMKQVKAQAQYVEPGRSLVELCAPKELASLTTELSLPHSPAASSKNTIVSQPFCRSDEGPLLPSASTTLSFLSSDSNVSIEHRVTDLTCLQALADLAVPFQETGDGKSRTGAPNLPDTPKPESHALQELHHSQREPQPQLQHQEGEQQMQQWNEQPMSPRATSAEERSARSSRRLRMLQQAKRQDSKEDRSSRLPKRPNTGERQRVGRFAAKERRWGDDILRVIMMGNKHYLHERSTTSPRPLPAAIAAVPPLDETQYVAQQIDRTPAATQDSVHTSPSPELGPATDVVRTVAVPVERAIVPALSRDSSARGCKQASPGSSDARQEKRMSSSPSDRVPQRSSSRASSRPHAAVTSQDSLTARHHATWGPSGEHRKMETIAEAVCEIELQDPQAVAEAVEPKVSALVTGDVLSGDTLELVKSPIQVAVVEDSTDRFAPSITSELGAESQLTPTWPQWDARERDLLASVKMLSAAVGTPESFSKTIELPSPEGLLMSETSTVTSRADAVGPSSIGCSVVLEPSASALSHTRTGSPKSVRSRRPSILEGPCFESIYNSILQSGSSPGLSLSIPKIGSRDFAGLFGIRGRPSGPTSECLAGTSQTEDSTDGVAAAEAARASGSSNLTAPLPSGGGSREVLAPHATETTTVAHCEEREDPNRRTPPLMGEAPSRYDRGSSDSHQPSSGPMLQGEAMAGDVQYEAGSDEDERSSFVSFEESASETCLLPDAASKEWTASSTASSSRGDLG